eukprot:596787-Amphidinium_carterae.1
MSSTTRLQPSEIATEIRLADLKRVCNLCSMLCWVATLNALQAIHYACELGRLDVVCSSTIGRSAVRKH